MNNAELVKKFNETDPDEYMKPRNSSASSSPACSTATVPVDDAGTPIVTNEMKAECIGEFTWDEEWPYYDEDGVLHEDHIHTHCVPWSVCKEIYKRMAKVAAASR